VAPQPPCHGLKDPKYAKDKRVLNNYASVTIISFGAAFPMNLFTSRMFPKVPRAMTASLPRLHTRKGTTKTQSIDIPDHVKKNPIFMGTEMSSN